MDRRLLVKRPEVERVRGRRESLYRATVDLEHALASPAADFGSWSSQVLGAAQVLEERIEAHSSESEAPGEFLSNIATEAPHLTNAAKHLQDEHLVMGQRSAALVELVKALAGATPSDVAETVRGTGLELLALIARHRQRGADLMFLAHNEDLGSAG